MKDSTERLHALDAVRGFALLAGIVFHATVSFLPSPLWIVMDNHPSLALALTFHVLHIFRMTTFFFVAGYFAHLTFHRKGARAFVRDRLKRIALPLVVGWPILFASILAVTIWGAVVMAHGRPLPPPPPYRFPATFLARGAVVSLDRSGRIRQRVDGVVRALALSGLLPVVLAAPAAAALFLTPDWVLWFGIPTPDSSLVPNAPAATAFATAFFFGWIAHRDATLLETWRRRWPLHLLAALLFTAAGLGIVGLAPTIVPETRLWLKLAYAVCYTLAAWSWTFALVGMALRFLSRFSPVRRYIADASYWLYLVHLPIVMALQVAVSRLDWPWYAKFALIVGVAFPLMFATYALFVRGTFIGAVLNGRRMGRTPRPNPAQLVADSA
jgi:glucan biosynthesis protein C